MAARRKCVICNEPIVDEGGVPYKGRYAHKKCFNIAIKTLQKEKICRVCFFISIVQRENFYIFPTGVLFIEQVMWS